MLNTKPEPVTSVGVRAKNIKDASQGRVMAIKGAPSAVAKGSLGARNSACIINGK